jgi:hypothetical protein
MGKNRRYTDELVQKILDYYVIDSNYTHVAEQLNIGVTQIRRIVSSNKERVVLLKKDREPILDRMFTEIIEKCSEKELELVSTSKDLRAVATVKGINYDKRALSRGEPTERLHVETEAELNQRMYRQLKGAIKPQKGYKKTDNRIIREMARN